MFFLGKKQALGFKYTGGPHYPQSFYLRIRLFTLEKMVKKDKIFSQNFAILF
jgi:hypothetical protein